MLLRGANIAALGILTFWGGNIARSQEQGWMSYAFTLNGQPASVLVDMDFEKNVRSQPLPYLVITGPRSSPCGANGMPDSTMLHNMEDALDATEHYLKTVTSIALSGTVTRNCERLNYYYVSDTSSVRNAIKRLYQRNFPYFAGVLNVKYDPEKLTYSKFLYPSDTQQNSIANNSIIYELYRQGDKLNGARVLTFGACFVSEAAKSAMSDYLVVHGFKIARDKTVSQSKYPFCLVFTKSFFLKSNELQRETLDLREQIGIQSGIYLKWSTPAVITNK